MRNHRAPVCFISQLQCVVFISGFSALVLEVVYAKLLRYWAGNTAYAVASVLCAYMSGLALGSLAGGNWLLRRKNLLAIYGGLEAVIGLYSAGLPKLMAYLEPLYQSSVIRLGPGTPLAPMGQFLAAGMMLLVPTLLMGASFPVLVRAASLGRTDRPDVAEKLYAANLAGAAWGALLSEFLLIRTWGLDGALLVVVVLNAAVAAWAVVLGRHPGAFGESEQPNPPGRSMVGESALLLLVGLGGGFVVLFQEVVWTHMAGRFLDNTVYGFALSLFAVISGLALGAILVARNSAGRPARTILPWTCVVAGVFISFLIPFWGKARFLAERYPRLLQFSAIAVLAVAGLLLVRHSKVLACAIAVLPVTLATALLYWRLRPSGALFWNHHGTDFAVCMLFMLGPAVLMGMIFPLAVELYVGAPGGHSATVAPLYAANTLGSVAGVVAATFLVVPRLGLEPSGRAGGLALLVIGLLLMARWQKQRGIAFSVVAPVLLWELLVPGWDFSRIYSPSDPGGRTVYVREDLNGGITTVVREGSSTRLYTNGMIQAGSDYLVGDQARCALVPLLHARELERAMVIGLGSGQTAGIVGLFPFKEIELVDFSPGIIEAGRRFFAEINLEIYGDRRVRTHVADGRNYLLTHPERLSMLTIEVSRLWWAGEGDLYTREFYELCAERLGERGVLQQWVPLFRLSFRDALIILRTIRAAFPHVAMYLGSESGLVVASRSPLQSDYASLRRMDSDPRLQAVLARINLPSIFSVMGDCVLVSEGVDALLEKVPERIVSTDLRPHLEHSTARYYLEGMTTGAARRFFLTAQEFRTLPILGLDEASRADVQRLVLEERSRQMARVEHF